MNTSKMTYADALSYVLSDAISLPADVREKLTQLHGQYTKPSTGERKPTKVQKENLVLVDALRGFVQPEVRYTITDFSKSVPALEGLSCQKLSALVKKLVDVKFLTRCEEKGQTFYVKA